MVRGEGVTEEHGAGVSAVILAGGGSRRFGSEKTAAMVGGRQVLELVVDAAIPHANEVLVIGPWAPSGATHILETDRGEGPLNALAFALDQVRNPLTLVLGGDHPLLSHALLKELVQLQHGSAAIVPKVADRAQPLVACYRTDVADTAKALVSSGERRLTALLDTIEVRWMEEVEWRAADPEGLSFMDVDTTEDLEQVRQAWIRQAWNFRSNELKSKEE